MRFGRRLAAAVGAYGPLCVGIDPHSGLLADWGLPDDASGVERFGRTLVDSLADEVALIKPQSAFFERHGSRGVAALEAVLADACAAGLLVLLDVKRGDIGSTMGGYAEAYLSDGSPLAADAITVSPYLGFGSLEPALELASRTGRGVFVLARTSNPEGASVQEARAGDRSVAQTVVDEVSARNIGADPLGDVGVVVGATGEYHLDLAALNGPVLAPGLGAQGATPTDIAARFTGVSGTVLPTASRSVLRHGPGAASLRAAVRELRDELANAAG
ncbi:MAG TPA: orotidine-5'-phosphate decarboxylase [Pseudonocardia sp.]|nr:orotidine-5'-phosphate decarboxylase [Pseudonocardia sp.]